VRGLDPYLKDSKTAELSPEQRKQRDDLIWNSFPPLNAPRTGIAPSAFPVGEIINPPVADRKAFEEKNGTWQWQDAGFGPLTLVNPKLSLTYTRNDFENQHPLPAPYPFQDDGWGAYLPQTAGMDHAKNFAPIAPLVLDRWCYIMGLLAPWDGFELNYRLPYLYHALGDKRAARDAAMLLCRWAYIYPAFTLAQNLEFNLISPASIYNRDLKLDRKGTDDGLRGLEQGLAVSYDYLFDYIKGNQELATAVGRYIPWVKTDKDVRRLIETRVLQYGAKQCEYFNIVTDKESPEYLMRTIAVQQDPEVTRPWMDVLFSKTWIYPHQLAGLPDYISTTTQRDGTTDIGSVYYTWGGSSFLNAAQMSHRWVQNGGDPKYDLTDTRHFRKLIEAGLFPLDSAVAGGYPMTIGDVGAPDKYRIVSVFNLLGFEGIFRRGYRISGDPRLAWLVKEYWGRKDESDADWQKLTADAARQKRNPLLDQKSRVLANWAGILESGQESDDFRFKRTAYLRVGTGYGHSHNDTLDLQIMAHGVRALNDVGWRGSYSQPNSEASMVYNVVEVNETNWHGHAWISDFAPTAGVQYQQAIAIPPRALGEVKARSREVALIDVDSGIPGAQPPSPLPYSDETKFDPKAVTPNSYVFDVQRTSGGKVHTFCFHGTYSDDFAVNMEGRTATLQDPEANYLRRFLQGEKYKYEGSVPTGENLTATWRLRRATETIEALKRDGTPVSLKQSNAESNMQINAYNENTPRKWTRLHLPGHSGERVMVAYIQPLETNVRSTWPFLFVQKRLPEGRSDLESVYASVIEPYAGEPFLTDVKELPVDDNENDSQRAVALSIHTKNGRSDLCFSDGRVKPHRTLTWDNNNYAVTGRFAYVSRDAKGLRLASLVEGTGMKTPWGTLIMNRANWTGTITRVDPWQRKVWLSADWSDARLPGEQVELGNDNHKTSYTVVAAEQQDGVTVLTLDKAFDLSYAHVRKVIPEKNTVIVNIAPVNAFPGADSGLTCTNEDGTKNWKCKLLGEVDNGFAYELDRAATETDFTIDSVFRLWEFGAGDTARLAARASVRRTSDNKLVVETNGKALWKPAQ
jgi:hypothetical protein